MSQLSLSDSLDSMKSDDLKLSGHQPHQFRGQRGAILDELRAARGAWVPAYKLAALALQYAARLSELRASGFVIENHVERVGRQVHGSYRLVSEPGGVCE